MALLVVVSSCGADGTTSPPTSADGQWSLDPDDRIAEFATTPWSTEAYEATDMRFLPDGRALLIAKGGWGGPGIGKVYLLDPGGEQVREILDVPVCADAERGLLGIELDPDFADNSLVYLFYTRQMSACAMTSDPVQDGVTDPVYNRISAFTFDEAGIDPASERVILDELPGHQSSHNGGGMAFLGDTLLVGVGEGKYERSRELDFPAGKVLGLDPDRPGEGSRSNPGFDAARPTGIESLVYASGLRNPFRLAVDPVSGSVALTDVGTDVFEEINLVRPGDDFGFPDIEGPGGDDGTTEPAVWYTHESGCTSIIGAAWVPAGWVPGTASPGFVFSDFGCGGMFVAHFDAAGAATDIVQIAGPLGHSIASIVRGPDDALYAVGIGAGPQQVLRVAPVSGA